MNHDSVLVVLVIVSIALCVVLWRQYSKKSSFLISSETKYKILFEDSLTAIVLAEADSGLIIDCNSAAETLFGRPKTQLIGMHQKDLHPENENDGVVSKTFKQHTTKSINTSLESQIVTSQGEIKDVEIMAHAIDLNGEKIIQGVFQDITLRKKEVRALRDSEALFKTLTDTMPMAIYVTTDLDQRCEYMNTTFTELFGYTMEDVPSVAEWWPKAYPDETYSSQVTQEWQDKVARAIETQSTIEPMEVVVTCKDGSTKDILWGYTSLGKLNYAFGLDVTERNRAIEKITEDEKRFRALFESIADYALVLKMQDEGPPIILDANEAAFKKHGYSREEMVGQPITLVDKHADPERIATLLNQIKSGKVIHFEVTHTHKDGSTFNVEASSQIILGSESIYFSVEHDITERKQSQLKIEKLSQAVMQSGEAVIITSADGVIEYVNPSFTLVTGYSEEEAIGQNPRMLKSGNQSASYYIDMWKQLRAGNPWQGKVVNRKKSGDFYPAMLTISPIKNSEGKIVSYIGLQQNLEQFEKLEAQFHQAQKMEAIGTLVGGIAHDFNNILAGIIGNLYLAERRSEDTYVSEKLATISLLSNRSAELIEQLLTFARKGVIHRSPLPLAPFIKEALKLLRSSVPEDVAIECDICSDDLIVNGDGTQLHQVLMNLVNNAWHATEGKDHPYIKVRLEKIQADASFIKQHDTLTSGAYASLTVEDNGCGIPDNQIEHLFEPFFTTKEQGKGTGLGLAMCFGAIQSHEGVIEVESSEGKGSLFHIYLPLMNAEKIIQQHQNSTTAISGNGELILLVDDEKQVIEVNQQLLESLNYRVITASNGLEAVEMFAERSSEVSLVITDVVMPTLGGVKAVERMKEIRQNLKVIFLTGYDKGMASKGSPLSNEHIIISKPFDVVHLSNEINKLLKE